MLAIFEEQRKIDYQLEIEGAAAASQAEIGMIPESAGQDILAASKSGSVTAERVKQLEEITDHDTAALVQALGEGCRQDSRPWVHFGLTSSDLVDTSNSMQMRDALDIIQPKIAALALALADLATRHNDLPAVGRTHGQHASIISFGLKFANWAEEMAEHLRRIDDSRGRMLICKTLGVVGTGSLMGAKATTVQRLVAERLGLQPARVATQVVPRERYAEYVFETALVGATLEKIAVEIRNLQRTEIGEASEQFRKGQVGSSAVPVKRNPIKSERISSLSRLLRGQVSVAFENIPLWHERDLTNSANERFIIPISAIILDEMLEAMIKIVGGLQINEDRILENLTATRGQIFAEFVLEAMIRKGIPRMQAYRDVQRVAFYAKEHNMDYIDAVAADAAISSVLSRDEIKKIFAPKRHLGASRSIIGSVCRSVRKTAKRFT
jgi:adenylosuccinate lyase